MTEPLTDAALRRLKRSGGRQAATDPSVLALLATVANGYPHARIHWLTESREAILNDWHSKRLLKAGRLAAMIDKASSVGALRKLAASDLQQYANDQRRGELPTRLFKRLDKLLRADPNRFTTMLASAERGSTYWTLTSRPATAIFSERDPELKAHVFAVSLKTLDEDPDAGKQSQFIAAGELERYAFEMLDRSARALTLDQLVRGLVVTYGLDPAFEQPPDENDLGGGFYGSERAGVPTLDPPDVPRDDRSAAAQRLIASLTARQLEVLKKFLEGITNQSEIAAALGCSAATISSETGTLRAVISALAPPEEQPEVLHATANLLYGDGHEL